MNRRELLSTTILTALTGCLEDTNNTTTTTDTATHTTTAQRSHTDSKTDTQNSETDPPQYEATHQERVDLDGKPFTELRIDVLPKEVPFTGDVELKEQPSDGDDGKLWIELHNQDDRSWTIEAAVPLPFPPTGSDGGLWVSETPAPETEDGCARGPAGADAAIEKDQIEPDGRIDGDRYIHALYDTQTCYRFGEHAFRNYYKVYNNGDSEQPKLKFKWGFSLISE